MESLLLNVLKNEEYQAERAFMRKHYVEDINLALLDAQLNVFKILMKANSSDDFTCFDHINTKVKKLTGPEKAMITEAVKICYLILINSASSASGERSFSAAKRLKTWLRSTMSQERFSNLIILNNAQGKNR